MGCWLVHRRDPQLFYTLLISHAEEVLPFVYTPAVGEACQRYHVLPLTPRGLYLRATDAGRFLERLRAWPRQDIRCVGQPARRRVRLCTALFVSIILPGCQAPARRSGRVFEDQPLCV